MNNKIMIVSLSIVSLLMVFTIKTTGNGVSVAKDELASINLDIDTRLAMIQELNSSSKISSEIIANEVIPTIAAVELDETEVVDELTPIEVKIRSMAVAIPSYAGTFNTPSLPSDPDSYKALTNRYKGPNEFGRLVPGYSEVGNDVTWINIMDGYIVKMSTNLLNSTDASLNEDKASWIESTLYEDYSESSPEYDMSTYQEDDNFIIVDLYNKYENFTVNMVLDKKRLVLYYRDSDVYESGYYFREGQ